MWWSVVDGRRRWSLDRRPVRRCSLATDEAREERDAGNSRIPDNESAVEHVGSTDSSEEAAMGAGMILGIH